MSHLILFACLVLVAWLIRRDGARRPGVSGAIWIPTLWVGILASRPVSAWLGSGGGDTLEGSPVDRLFFFGLMFASLVVLARRHTPWATLLARNWPILLFYLFLLVTVLWANSPLSSLKRWTKECGNILIVLVILSEANPLQAIRAVFVRCAYALIPLSIVLIRYFPDLGRRYSQHSGQLELTGVTTQKNSLGAMILVCGLIFVWDWLESSRPGAAVRSRAEKFAVLAIGLAGAWLIYQSDSKTSLACLVLGCGLIAAVRLPLLRRRIGAMGTYVLLAIVAGLILEWAFGMSATVVSNLGRDMTFTGRTDVWRELLALKTDPIFGTGFMSLWDDPQHRARLPQWVAGSAHNGYLEIYLAGGAIGVAFLVLMLLQTGRRLNQALRADGSDFAVVRFAIFVAMLIANFAESNFACMTPLGVLFLIAAIGDTSVVRPPLAANTPARARPVAVAPPEPAPSLVHPRRRFV
jgi:O-antigen ligase